MRGLNNGLKTSAITHTHTHTQAHLIRTLTYTHIHTYIHLSYIISRTHIHTKPNTHSHVYTRTSHTHTHTHTHTSISHSGSSSGGGRDEGCRQSDCFPRHSPIEGAIFSDARLNHFRRWSSRNNKIAILSPSCHVYPT